MDIVEWWNTDSLWLEYEWWFGTQMHIEPLSTCSTKLCGPSGKSHKALFCHLISVLRIHSEDQKRVSLCNKACVSHQQTADCFVAGFKILLTASGIFSVLQISRWYLFASLPSLWHQALLYPDAFLNTVQDLPLVSMLRYLQTLTTPVSYFYSQFLCQNPI